MSTRMRSRASAAPGHSHSTPRASGSSRANPSSTGRSSTPPLPEYEPLSAPLNPSAQRALTALLEAKSIRDLKKHLQAAGERLAETAGEVNERRTDAKLRLERERLKGQTGKGRKQNDKGKGKESVKNERGEDDMDEDEVAEDEEEEDEEMDNDITETSEDLQYEEKARKISEFSERVKDVTAQLEGKVREMIDAEVQLDGLTGVMKDIEKEATQSQNQVDVNRRTTRRTRRGGDEEDTEMVDTNDGEDNGDSENEDHEETPAYGDGKPTLLQTLEERLAENDSQWKSQSLTQRYSNNNTYIGFYRTTFEAKHPGDEIPPLPHSSTWFSHLEGDRESNLPASTFTSPLPQRTRNPNTSTPTRTGRHRVANNEDEDDDVAIDRERISLKCPLTLLPFQDPVSSTRCPHSFERQAIEEMIQRSSTTIPDPESVQQGTTSRRGGKRIKCVECPVCSVKLTLKDLRRDPVLVRRVRRFEAALRQREADDQLDPEGARRRRVKGGRQSGFTVASGGESGDEGVEGEDDDTVDDEEIANRAASVKRERASKSLRRHDSSSSDDGGNDEYEVEDD